MSLLSESSHLTFVDVFVSQITTAIFETHSTVLQIVTCGITTTMLHYFITMWISKLYRDRTTIHTWWIDAFAQLIFDPAGGVAKTQMPLSTYRH